ncbi:MAG: 30S ribosomal protein S13 [Candidatus Paceibacterota bacterium]|jgi:small subunit ribosomal protein S13
MRVLGITIPDDKRLEIGLTSVFGIGRPLAHKILEVSNVDFGKKAKELTTNEENEIRKNIEAYKLEGELRREVSGNIKRLRDIKCYRGVRHQKRLPARGQRTKTNARTLKGVKKTAGSGRKKEAKK